MRALVVREMGREPELGSFVDPAPEQEPVRVVAAALNPIDLVVAAGQTPFRPARAPFVAGLEGVARLSDGSHRYFSGPALPFGSLAEWVPLRGTEQVTVPVSVEPVLAAALGVSGLAAWLSMKDTGHLKPGEKVLILGASGQVGRIAIQVARLLGASEVIAVVKDETERAIPLALGADAAVVVEDPAQLTTTLRAITPDGFDLVLDLVWGPVIGPAMAAAKAGARVVQVGNSGGAIAELSALIVRNHSIHILPHSNFLFTDVDRARAYSSLADHASRGEITLDIETVPLTGAVDAWRRLAAGTSTRKLVIRPVI
jgi:NADPH:quinone reductase